VKNEAVKIISSLNENNDQKLFLQSTIQSLTNKKQSCDVELNHIKQSEEALDIIIHDYFEKVQCCIIPFFFY
jgi:glycosylphosphatidylinositol transamidase (GPIT) subunit GPI8